MVLPAWLLAVGLPLAAICVLPRQTAQGCATFLAVLGCVLLGSSAIGPEFSNGTMGQLLVQPCERRRLWLMKMAVLAAALTPFLVVAVLMQAAWRGEPAVVLALLVPLCALCAVPALTLIARNGLGATVLSIALPLLVFGIAVAVTTWLYGRVNFPEQEKDFEQTLVRACFGALCVYCAAACWFGYWKFMRFQVADSLSRELPLGKLIEAPLAGIVNRLFGRRQRAFASLLRKELRLQHASFLIAAAFAIIFAVMLVVLPSLHAEYRDVALMLPVVLLAGIIPLVAGAQSVAEERNLGLHAWLLTLPVPLWKQWLVKLAVTLGASCALGVMLPWLFLIAGHARNEEIGSPMSEELWPVLMIVLGQMLFTALAVFASSLSFATLRAVMGCIGLLTAMGLSTYLIGMLENKLGLHQLIEAFPVASRAGLFDNWDAGQAIATAGMALGILLLGVLAYSNFRSIEITRRRWWGQVLMLVVGMPMLAVALTLLAVFLSAWP
jgi:ABC-type transport system involved in multi-copper enzyme maturation permease subunit